jgi:hypothetical protein
MGEASLSRSLMPPLLILGFAVCLATQRLAGQHADAACPQQAGILPSATDPDGFSSLAWTRNRVIEGQPRLLTLIHGARSDIITLANKTGVHLDQVTVGSVDSSRFRSLVRADSALILLYSHGGGGQGAWRAVQIVHVTACWLNVVFAEPTWSADFGPDSFVTRDSATISFLDARHIQVNGVRDQAIVTDDPDAPTPLPDTRCAYRSVWVWDSTAGAFAKKDERRGGPGCAGT